ncbi:MAG: hypothetical protein KDC19_14790, partial [Saprospiraceae bacterium]|nr:hypothetical protein [Saprospiraceae bacterium]
QGKTAVLEKDAYSLAVLTRPEDDQAVTSDYFKEHARFVPDIGSQIGNSIEDWSNGLQALDTHAEVKVSLDDKIESVYISRNIWKNGIPFGEFVDLVKNYFR